MSLKRMLEDVAARYGGKTAIILGDRRLSFAELDEASNRMANALIKMGVNKGDRVAILLPNSPEFAVTYFGIAKIGAIAALLDTNYKFDELASVFNDCLPEVLVTESPALEPLIPVLPRFQSIEHIIDLSPKYAGKFISYQEIMASSPAQRVNVEPGPEDIAHIGYTSGPSFYPRGIMLSHGQLVREANISGDGFQQTDNEMMILFALPLHHMFGFVAALLASLFKGSTVVIVPGTGLSIGSLMATIESVKGTMFLGVPYIFALMIDMAEREGIKNDLSSLRLCISAGAPLPIDTIQRFKRYFGFDIIDVWGLSEATCHVTCPSLNGTGKIGSAGKALPGWEVKIVDDKGRESPPGQAGEIIVRGLVMKGYYNNPQATAETIRDGWLYTGDIGKLDEEGNLFITGRKKDTIIVKGQNIYPGDIESVLSTHPEVVEAAVIGIPDALRGEIVGAAIRLKEGAAATEQEIKRFCLERIASYKAPKQVMFLDSLPRTATGQIDREGLRKRLLIPPVFPETATP
ncbi:class I adenylate-forming enzyme family protein [Chloroflexota bacterium]